MTLSKSSQWKEQLLGDSIRIQLFKSSLSCCDRKEVGRWLVVNEGRVLKDAGEEYIQGHGVTVLSVIVVSSGYSDTKAYHNVPFKCVQGIGG